MKKYTIIFITIMILTAIFFIKKDYILSKFFSSSKFGKTEGVVMQINDSILTLKDLNEMIPDNNLSSYTEEQIKQLIEQWKTTELISQEAVKRGINNNSKIRLRIENMRKQILADMLLQIELEEKIKVTEEEAQEYYDKNKDSFTRKNDEVLLYHILTNNQKDCENIITQLKNKDDFFDIASDFSIAPSAENKGYLGIYEVAKLRKEFRNAIKSLKAGNYTKTPIKTEAGYHILLVKDIFDAGTTKSFDEVKNNIINTIQKEKEKKFYKNFTTELEKKASIYENFDIILTQ